jgi:hypothetical protein
VALGVSARARRSSATANSSWPCPKRSVSLRRGGPAIVAVVAVRRWDHDRPTGVAPEVLPWGRPAGQDLPAQSSVGKDLRSGQTAGHVFHPTGRSAGLPTAVAHERRPRHIAARRCAVQAAPPRAALTHNDPGWPRRCPARTLQRPPSGKTVRLVGPLHEVSVGWPIRGQRLAACSVLA